MNISHKSYFEIFSLEESFLIDLVSLKQEYKKLQAQFHPDKFVNADDRQRLEALQSASIINEAYTTLNSPLKLAAYLLVLHAVDPEENNQSHLGGGFLFQQMALREKLAIIAEGHQLSELDELKNDIEKDKCNLLIEFSDFYQKGFYVEAKPVYSKLQFIYKLLHEIDAVEEKLLDY